MDNMDKRDTAHFNAGFIFGGCIIVLVYVIASEISPKVWANYETKQLLHPQEIKVDIIKNDTTYFYNLK